MSFSSWLRNWKLCLENRSARIQAHQRKSAAGRMARRIRCVRPRLEVLEDRLAPATLTVNSPFDTVSGSTPTLDLREAIMLVNSGGTATDSSGNSLAAAKASQISGTFGVNDTIQFDAGLNGQTITLSGSALPALSKSMTITGQGAPNLAISGNNQSQIFFVDPGATVVIAGLIIEGGNSEEGGAIYNNDGTLTVSDSILEDNSSAYGGAIYNNSNGTLTVSYSRLADNTATASGALGGGGGIYNVGTLEVNSSTLSGNAGGGIFNLNALTVDHSTIADNYGAGIYTNAASLAVDYSTIADNSGGGIFNQYSTVTVDKSTLVGNTVGGGIYSYDSTLTVVNSTLADNSDVGGGGIFNDDSTLTVINSTLADNSSTVGGGIANVEGGLATLNNTIVAGNTGGDLYLDAGYGSVFSGSNDLIGDGSGGLSTANNNLLGSSASPLDPLLAPLGNYGGPTQTMPLLLGSPAIAAGSVALAVDTDGNPLAIDQRGLGFPRIINGTVDIGAVESDGASLTSLLQQALSQSNSVMVQVNSESDANEFLNAVNNLTAPSTPATVTLNLAAGASFSDITAAPPAGVTLVINGQGGTTTIVGKSPALTVSSGSVIVTGMTLTTATDAPTILVTVYCPSRNRNLPS